MGTETSGSVILREARPEEAHAIYEIGRLCFSDAWREETVARDMAGPHSLYVVAEQDGQIAGYGCYWFVADEAQLVNIGILPAARRRGIAGRILTDGMAYAVSRGMVSMYLEVRVSNLPAQALYRKHGFKVITLRKNVYDLPREDGYIMARPLMKPQAGGRPGE